MSALTLEDEPTLRESMTDRELGEERKCSNQECVEWMRFGVVDEVHDASSGLCASCFVDALYLDFTEATASFDRDENQAQWCRLDEGLSVIDEERQALVEMVTRRWKRLKKARKATAKAMGARHA